MKESIWTAVMILAAIIIYGLGCWAVDEARKRAGR